MSALHSQQTDVHVPFAWTYANAVARAAATGFVAADVGKLCLQADTSALYILTATTPVWVAAIMTGDIDADTLQTHAADFFAEAAHGHAPGPATDADTVDGSHAADFAADDHDHSGVYAPDSHTHAPGDAATLESHNAAYFAVDGHTHSPGDAATLESHAASYFAVDGHSHSAPALDDLTDVTLGTPSSGDALVYDTDHWEAAPISAGASALDDLTDVTLGTPSTGDVLTYDTDHWKAAAPTGGVAATSKIGCAVSRTTTQAITTATPTALSWNSEIRDDGGCWDVGTPTRLTAPVEGWYAISAFVWWTGFTGAGRRLYILKDGTTTIGRQSTAGDSLHNDPANQVSAVYYFTVGQYVEFMVDQNSTASVNVQAGAMAGMVLVAPLAGGPVSRFWNPDAPPMSAGAIDDEFDDSSVSGSWTEYDPHSLLTVAEDDYGLSLSQATSAADNVCGLYRAIPAGDFTITTKVSMIGFGVPCCTGIALWEDGADDTKKVQTFQLETNTWATSILLRVTRWSNHSTFAATMASEGPMNDARTIYLRIRRSGTTYYFDKSLDGIAWLLVFTDASLGMTPAHFGMYTNNINSGVTIKAIYPFFRYVASDIGGYAILNGRRVHVGG